MAEPFQLETPVVFLVFNRPDCTRRVFEEIRRARPPRLFVVGDGPRSGRPDDVAQVREVREIIERGVDWPCVVETNYVEANLGCGRRVSSGLDWVFAQEPEAIVLEDDCLPDPTFFRFCAELLVRYRNDERVGQICGCSFQGPVPENGPSYYFSRYPHCWGWATWWRAWRLYDHSMKAWQDERGENLLAAHKLTRAEGRYWKKNLDATVQGKVDSWAYRWTVALWHEDCLSIGPYHNLVSNIGFDMDATHTRGLSPAAALPLAGISFPLVSPEAFARDEKADERTSRLLFRRSSLGSKLRGRFAKIFS